MSVYPLSRSNPLDWLTVSDQETRRAARLAAYDSLRAQRPQLFANPPGAAYEIVFDPAIQEQVADEAAARLKQAGIPEQYGDIGVIYQDAYMMIVRDAVRFRSGSHGVYVREISPRQGAGAAVLPLAPDGRIPLLRHFRHATRTWHWELPRGFGEPGSDGAQTARREIEEELGVGVVDVTLLGRLDTDTGADADGDEIYLARLVEEPAAHTAHAVQEGIDTVALVTPAEFVAMIRNGELSDSFTLAAFAYATALGLWPESA